MKNTLLSLALLALGSSVAAQDQSEISKRIESAMSADSRPEADSARDANRRPVRTLEFFGIREDMKVLELLPGGGWYTRLLAPALRDDGALHVALNTTRVKEQLAGQAPFDRINVIEPAGLSFARADQDGVRLFTVSAFSLGETGFDAALTFRNMHNFDAAGRNNINNAVFAALNPGGIYGVVDHTRRHMESITKENRRRADPVEIIKEVLDAGFELVDYSDLHFKLDDELRYEVGRPSVTGNTDRFTLLFRKPE